MEVILILSVLMVGEAQPRQQAVQMPSVEECIATSHKMLLAGEKDLSPDKVAGYSTQCVVMLKPGVKA